MKTNENELNPGVNQEDIEQLQAAVDEQQNPLEGLTFIQSIVMAIPVKGKMTHVQISMFHDNDGFVRLFYDVVDVSKVNVPSSDNA